MQLLCLTDLSPSNALPALEFLPHELRSSPLGVRVPASAASQFDLLLIDASKDIRRARTTCLELARDCPRPRLLICNETALPAVTPEWALCDVLLPGASPVEIEMRLRLAAGKDAAAREAAAHTPTAVRSSGVVIDEGNFTARVRGRTLDLTYKEFELLHFLARNPGRVFTREQLLSQVWGTDYYGGTRTVDVHVRRLRAKLGEFESLIGTVRGVGYGFARETEAGAGPGAEQATQPEATPVAQGAGLA